MLRNINWSAFLFFTKLETHPEARTLKQYHEDLAQIVEVIRKKYPNPDKAFRVSADAIIDEIVPNGVMLESVSVLDSMEIDAKRRAGVNKLGPDRLPAIEGEASYELVIGLIGLLEKLLKKEYWPSADCPTTLGQSFLSAYVKDFEERLQAQYKKSIEKLASRKSAYESQRGEKREEKQEEEQKDVLRVLKM